MSRNRMILPATFPFRTEIPVRITDINYGKHLGNDKVLTLASEARVQFIRHLGFHEWDIAGAGLIMADAAIEFRQEINYGDKLMVFVAASNIQRSGFDLFYKFMKDDGHDPACAAVVRTGMVCFDYVEKKVRRIPESFREKLSSFEVEM